jgi:hypothetical protein
MCLPKLVSPGHPNLPVLDSDVTERTAGFICSPWKNGYAPVVDNQSAHATRAWTAAAKRRCIGYPQLPDGSLRPDALTLAKQPIEYFQKTLKTYGGYLHKLIAM